MHVLGHLSGCDQDWGVLQGVLGLVLVPGLPVLSLHNVKRLKKHWSASHYIFAKGMKNGIKIIAQDELIFLQQVTLKVIDLKTQKQPL